MNTGDYIRQKESLKGDYDKKYQEYQNLYNEVKSKYGSDGLDKLLSSQSANYSLGSNMDAWGKTYGSLVENNKKWTQELDDAMAKLKERQSQGGQTVAESEAAQLANAAATQQAQAQEIAAKNTGLSDSRAGSLTSNNTYGNVYRDSVQGMANQQTMTQADWLEKMGYATGLQQQVDNLQKGSILNTIGAAFQGVSDENEKVEPNRDGKLPEADEYDAIGALEEVLNDYDGYVDDNDVLSQVAQLETVSYQYKHPEEDGEDFDVHKAGFTAQSLQKIPLFKKCVIDDNGTLKIDLDLLESIITEKVLPAIKAAIGED